MVCPQSEMGSEIVTAPLYSGAYQREELDADGTVNFVLAWLVQSYWQTIPMSSSAAILTLLTPVTSFLPDLKMTCRSRPPVSNAVYRLSLACFVFEILGGGYRPPPPSRRY